MTTGCVFCEEAGGQTLWRDERCRVVLADEPFAGFCRVIWNAHVREMTDLGDVDRDHLLHVVYAVESALRASLRPAKMNLAALGNVTPHLHWHVIPRFVDDSHFPQPVWGTKQRAAPSRELPADFAATISADIAVQFAGAAAR
jgi:diadenosine tetraphosphate (Ap4A) HIT family hydrolase